VPASPATNVESCADPGHTAYRNRAGSNHSTASKWPFAASSSHTSAEAKDIPVIGNKSYGNPGIDSAVSESDSMTLKRASADPLYGYNNHDARACHRHSLDKRVAGKQPAAGPKNQDVVGE